MISSPSLRIYAADEGSNNDKQSSDNNDGGSKDNGDSDGSGGVSKEEDSSNEGGTSEEDKPINRDELKGTPEEQEQAAREDYMYDTPGIVKPYPEQPKKEWIKTPENTYCKDKTECDKLSKPVKKDGPYQCHPDGKDNSKCIPKQPIKHIEDCKEKWNQDWNHNGKCDGHNGGHDHDGHDHHNNWCSHHDCHHHNHHSNTHFSDNHHGDVTVKVHVTDYKSNDLEDVHLIIGDVYEKNLDLSDEPDQIKVDNLDIDGGDDFAVCLANEDSDEGDCVVTHADNDHDEVNVNLKVF